MIHSTAIVSDKATIGRNVSVGAYSVIYDSVNIADDCEIGAFCEIGYPTPRAKDKPLIIGRGSLIRSHSIFYQGSTFAEGLTTGHRVTVREGAAAGSNLQIGTLGDIQGTCTIGNFVRLHSNVHIGQYSSIGDYVWIFPYVVLTNDPHPPSDVMRGVTVNDYVAIATMSVILPGVTLGRGALIGAHSSVSRDVAPDIVVAGSPAKPVCATHEIVLKDGSGNPAYPWRRHFHRGYPDVVVEAWLAEFGSSSSDLENLRGKS